MYKWCLEEKDETTHMLQQFLCQQLFAPIKGESNRLRLGPRTWKSGEEAIVTWGLAASPQQTAPLWPPGWGPEKD